MTPNSRAARAIADQALRFCLDDPYLVSTLMGVTGATPQALRQMLESEGLAQSCLDILMESDEHVLAFAEAAGLRPQDIAMAHAVLSAGPSEEF